MFFSLYYVCIKITKITVILASQNLDVLLSLLCVHTDYKITVILASLILNVLLSLLCVHKDYKNYSYISF